MKKFFAVLALLCAFFIAACDNGSKVNLKADRDDSDKTDTTPHNDDDITHDDGDSGDTLNDGDSSDPYDSENSNDPDRDKLVKTISPAIIPYTEYHFK